MTDFLEILEWDTQYFGFKVGKIEKDVLSVIQNTEYVFSQLEDKKIQLAYYNSSSLISTEVLGDTGYDINLVMSRIPLMMKLTEDFSLHPKVEVFQGREVNDKLIELAVLAGNKGRFGNDNRITNSTCAGIFKNWIINSVKGQRDKILVYKEGSKIIGMVSFKKQGDKGIGGLMAVDPDFEGKGISFALLRGMMTHLKNMGCRYFLSGTQKTNTKALKVFERFGLLAQKPEYIYHFWKE